MATAPNMAGWLADEHSSDLDDGLFRTHFDCLPGAAYIWKRSRDGEFALVAFNRAAAAAIGEARHVLGMTAGPLLKNLPGAEQALYRCADRREILVDEAEVRLPAIGIRRMVSTLLPLSASVVVVHMEDVTEQRAAAAAVAASERRFRALFQSHPDQVFRMDVAGNYLDVHVPDGAALPVPPDELLGRNIADVIGPEAAAQHWHYAREAIRTEETQTLEYEIEIAGRRRNVEARMRKCGDDEVVVNIRDITERAELERALTDARERERLRLGGELKARLAQLDLNVAQLKAMLSSATSSAIGDAIAALEASARRADELVHDLVPVAEGTPLVAALTALVAHTAQSRAVSCRLSRSGSVPPMIAETPDLYRVAQEAIANAVEHGEATEIDVICGVVNQNLVLNIIDNGKGFRLDATDNAGAGMRIMAHRARRLGGNLTRSRRAGGGTMVTCSCPIGGLGSVDGARNSLRDAG